jgi:ketosteroid isomerase-like protein
MPLSAKGDEMPANSPEEICILFRRYMREGDIDSVLTLYDPKAVFLSESEETKKGEALREELATLVAAKTIFDFSIKQVIQSGDIALMHTDWTVSSPRQMFFYAIEVARRQQDGTWRWLIGDPYTVGKRLAPDLE